MAAEVASPCVPVTHQVASRAAWSALALALSLVLVLLASLPVGAAEAKIIRSGPRSSGAVALTFDDGYNAAACGSIARTLRTHDAKGTFFVNGNHLKLQPAKWRRILKGMPVGNHTRSHRDLRLASARVVKKQIRENEALHERILGRPMLKVLRPPYGAHDRRVRLLAGQLGYKHTVLWSHDTLDWRASATVASIISRATNARPGSIILMHCARSATARALPAIIRHYKARGVKLVGLGRLLRLKASERAGANVTAGTGTPIEAAGPASLGRSAPPDPYRTDRHAGVPVPASDDSLPAAVKHATMDTLPSALGDLSASASGLLCRSGRRTFGHTSSGGTSPGSHVTTGSA